MTITKIQWTDATWNPVRGCSMAKGSETGGCLNCYAARQATRFVQGGGPFEGFARVTENGPRWTGKVDLVEKHLLDPLKWKEPRRVFVNSMSDLFHEALPDEAIDRVFDVMAVCPEHTFQVLTKRPERMLKYCRHRAKKMASVRANECPSLHSAFPDVLPNVWLGVSVEGQPTANARIPLLLQTPAAVRFVSYEPALGPVDFTSLEVGRNYWDCLSGCRFAPSALDWIIIGGESGPGARPFNVGWARDTIRACKAAEVACFVKQFGARPLVSDVGDDESWEWMLDHLDRKGGNWDVWPDDLRVREFPGRHEVTAS